MQQQTLAHTMEQLLTQYGLLRVLNELRYQCHYSASREGIEEAQVTQRAQQYDLADCTIDDLLGRLVTIPQKPRIKRKQAP